MPCLALLMATLAAAGPAPSSPPATSARQGTDRVDAILDRLRSSDPKAIARANQELSSLAEEGLSQREAARLLRAATGSFPKRTADLVPTPELLVSAAAAHPGAALVPVVEEVYARLPSGARTQALLLLMRVEERAGAEAVVRLLGGDRAARRRTELRTDPIREEPRHAAVYFPSLLELADGPSLFPVYAALLAACEADVLPTARLAALAPLVLAAWRPLREAARAVEAHRGPGWPWADGDREVREEAGLLLDVLGHLPGEAVRTELRAAVSFEDPKLAYFAAVALLRSGGEVPAGVLERVAASAEVRNWLYRALAKLERTELFPERWRTQKAFAESDMVIWLVYPTELGRPPDEIELVRVVSEKFIPEGFHDWYLFKFRTHAPHWAAKDGWMVGVAGPFKRADAPSPEAYGDTFSSFDRWEDATPEEHVRAVRETIAGWRKRRGQR